MLHMLHTYTSRQDLIDQNEPVGAKVHPFHRTDSLGRPVEHTPSLVLKASLDEPSERSLHPRKSQKLWTTK